jgi:hypothetical protein
VTTQAYDAVSRPGARLAKGALVVEIYRMSDPVAAAGVYFMQRGQETPEPSFRERHTLGRFQLLLVRDRFYVVVTNADGDAALRGTMLAFGRFIAGKLPPASPVALERALAPGGLIESSLRLIRGPHLLQTIYTLGDGDVLRLRGSATAVAGRYQPQSGGHTVIQVDYPDEPAARRALAHLSGALDSHLTVLARSHRRIVFRDHAREFGTIALTGRRLSVVVHLSRAPAPDGR